MTMLWLIIPFVCAVVVVWLLSWMRRRRTVLTPSELGRCLADAKLKTPE